MCAIQVSVVSVEGRFWEKQTYKSSETVPADNKVELNISYVI